MKIAVLFNSDHPQYECMYGDYIRNQIFSSDILQLSNRHLKISLGDVLIPHEEEREMYIKICEALYFTNSYNKLLASKLRATYLTATVFAWVIENVNEDIAERLHCYLIEDEAYLGIHDLDFSFLGHLVFYRNDMIPKYRIKGRDCILTYSMGNVDEICDYETNRLRELGFDNVYWEDNGAQKTIFDNYDTVDFFQQVKLVEKGIAIHLGADNDCTEEISMLIEDSNPYLFYPLVSAIKALDRAINKEDYAQVGISVRRYLEYLADTVFPARNEMYKGRNVNQSSYKNRIWAFITDMCLEDKNLGKKLDRLVDDANLAIHGTSDKKKITSCLIDLSVFTLSLLHSVPCGTIDRYYPYRAGLNDFFYQYNSGI